MAAPTGIQYERITESRRQIFDSQANFSSITVDSADATRAGSLTWKAGDKAVLITSVVWDNHSQPAIQAVDTETFVATPDFWAIFNASKDTHSVYMGANGFVEWPLSEFTTGSSVNSENRAVIRRSGSQAPEGFTTRGINIGVVIADKGQSAAVKQYIADGLMADADEQPLYFGGENVQKLYYGSTLVEKMYYGSTLAYEV